MEGLPHLRDSAALNKLALECVRPAVSSDDRRGPNGEHWFSALSVIH